jgi:Tfp pilus assembly PilM family ATPase
MRLVGVPKVPASQRDNAVFWTARKELSFDEKTVIFDFEDRGELVDKGAVKSAVFAHTIPRDAVTRRKASFERAGYALKGMTLTAFADQNVFRSGCLPPPPGGAANLHVGDNWSRLEIYRDGNLVFTRGIKAAMTALSGAVMEGLSEEPEPAKPVFEALSPTPDHEISLDLGGPDEVVLDLDGDAPAGPDAEGPRLLTLDLSGDAVHPESAAPAAEPKAEAAGPQDLKREAASADGLSEADARAVLLSLVEGGPAIAPGRPGYGLSQDEIMDLAEPALARLARQVEMTLKHYRETLGNDPVGALYVSGPLAAAPVFLEFLEGHLGIPCEAFDPLGATEIRRPGPGPDPAAMSLAGRCAFQQALGAALSLERMTPNLFVTYKERREARRVRMVNRTTLAVFLLLLAAVAGYSLFESGRNQVRTAELGRLQQQIAAQDVMVDTALINQTALEAQKTQKALRAFAARNLGLGTISELTSLTPADVRLLSLSVDMGPPVREPAPAQAGKAAKPAAKYIKKVILDGVVQGDSQLFESILAGYLVNLQNSPLFEGSTVSKRDVETMGGAQVLHFVVSLALAGQ